MEQGTINQRLNLIVDTFENGKKAAFARSTGISVQGVQELLAGRKGDPSFKVLIKILENYPQVCADWLVLGKGEMLDLKDYQVILAQAEDEIGKTPGAYCRRDVAIRAMELLNEQYKPVKANNEVPRTSNGTASSQKSVTGLLPSKQVVSTHHEWPLFISCLAQLMPTVSRGEQADYIKRVSQERMQTSTSTAVKATEEYACFEVKDSSMTSVLEEGQWLASRLINNQSELIPDSLCTVVTDTSIFTKYVSAGKNPGDIITYTYTPGSPPDYLLAKDILQVWICEMVLTSQI